MMAKINGRPVMNIAPKSARRTLPLCLMTIISDDQSKRGKRKFISTPSIPEKNEASVGIRKIKIISVVLTLNFIADTTVRKIIPGKVIIGATSTFARNICI